jgi:oligopeptide transport system substrate-binding protein
MRKSFFSIIMLIVISLVFQNISAASKPSPGILFPPAYETLYISINTKSYPLGNKLVRYALAMALDRESITNAIKDERFKFFPAIGLIPPFENYDILRSVQVLIDKKLYDVVSYNPIAARELLEKAGYSKGIDKSGKKFKLEILAYNGDEPDKLTSIIKKQWQQNLDIEVVIISKKWQEYLKAKDALEFSGVAIDGKSLLINDPSTLLDFASGQVSQNPSWQDAKFSQMLKKANKILPLGSNERNSEFRRCEEYIMKHMPVIPLCSKAINQ